MAFRHLAWLLVAVVAAAGGFASSQSDGQPYASLINPAELEAVFAGQAACFDPDSPACPQTDDCQDLCAGLAANDACAGDGYERANPNYRQAMPAASGGKKKEKTLSPAKLCGQLISCGPVCVDTAGLGLICPSASAPDYEVETVPDGGDCDEATAMVVRKTSLMASVFILNGGKLNAFGI